MLIATCAQHVSPYIIVKVGLPAPDDSIIWKLPHATKLKHCKGARVEVGGPSLEDAKDDPVPRPDELVPHSFWSNPPNFCEELLHCHDIVSIINLTSNDVVIPGVQRS